MKKPIAEASLAELRHFARVSLGLDIHHNAGDAKVHSALAAVGYDVSNPTLVIDIPDDAPVAAPRPVAKSEDWTYATVVIQHPTENDPDGIDPVPLRANDLILVPRGVESRIPRRHYEVLAGSVKDVYQTDRDGRMAETPTKIARFPFHTVRME